MRLLGESSAGCAGATAAAGGGGANPGATGLIAGRGADELGLGVAYARNGSHYLSAQSTQGTPATRAETAIELTYLMQINSWLALQPDLQYVVSPNTNPSLRNAFAFQLRIEVSY